MNIPKFIVLITAASLVLNPFLTVYAGSKHGDWGLENERNNSTLQLYSVKGTQTSQDNQEPIEKNKENRKKSSISTQHSDQDESQLQRNNDQYLWRLVQEIKGNPDTSIPEEVTIGLKTKRDHKRREYRTKKWNIDGTPDKRYKYYQRLDDRALSSSYSLPSDSSCSKADLPDFSDFESSDGDVIVNQFSQLPKKGNKNANKGQPENNKEGSEEQKSQSDKQPKSAPPLSLRSGRSHSDASSKFSTNMVGKSNSLSKHLYNNLAWEGIKYINELFYVNRIGLNENEMPLLDDLKSISFPFIRKILEFFIENKPIKDNKLLNEIYDQIHKEKNPKVILEKINKFIENLPDDKINNESTFWPWLLKEGGDQKKLKKFEEKINYLKYQFYPYIGEKLVNYKDTVQLVFEDEPIAQFIAETVASPDILKLDWDFIENEFNYINHILRISNSVKLPPHAEKDLSNINVVTADIEFTVNGKSSYFFPLYHENYPTFSFYESNFGTYQKLRSWLGESILTINREIIKKGGTQRDKQTQTEDTMISDNLTQPEESVLLRSNFLSEDSEYHSERALLMFLIDYNEHIIQQLMLMKSFPQLLDTDSLKVSLHTYSTRGACNVCDSVLIHPNTKLYKKFLKNINGGMLKAYREVSAQNDNKPMFQDEDEQLSSSKHKKKGKLNSNQDWIHNHHKQLNEKYYGIYKSMVFTSPYDLDNIYHSHERKIQEKTGQPWFVTDRTNLKDFKSPDFIKNFLFHTHSSPQRTFFISAGKRRQEEHETIRKIANDVLVNRGGSYYVLQDKKQGLPPSNQQYLAKTFQPSEQKIDNQSLSIFGKQEEDLSLLLALMHDLGMPLTLNQLYNPEVHEILKDAANQLRNREIPEGLKSTLSSVKPRHINNDDPIPSDWQEVSIDSDHYDCLLRSILTGVEGNQWAFHSTMTSRQVRDRLSALLGGLINADNSDTVRRQNALEAMFRHFWARAQQESSQGDQLLQDFLNLLIKDKKRSEALMKERKGFHSLLGRQLADLYQQEQTQAVRNNILEVQKVLNRNAVSDFNESPQSLEDFRRMRPDELMVQMTLFPDVAQWLFNYINEAIFKHNRWEQQSSEDTGELLAQVFGRHILIHRASHFDSYLNENYQFGNVDWPELHIRHNDYGAEKDSGDGAGFGHYTLLAHADDRQEQLKEQPKNKEDEENEKKGGLAFAHHAPSSFRQMFFSYYTKRMNEILALRLRSVRLDGNVKTLPAVYINEKKDNVPYFIKTLPRILPHTCKILAPINLYDRHWAGLIAERADGTSWLLTYIDPENQPIPTVLENKLRQHFAELAPEHKITIRQRQVETQKYGNCGPEVVENFIEYLIGQRVSQEAAVLLHSRLMEDHLLNRSTPASVLAAEFPPKPSHEKEFVVLTPEGQVFNPQNEAEIKLRDQLIHAHNGGMIFNSAKAGLAQGYKVQKLANRNDNAHDTIIASPNRLRAPSFDILDEKLQNQARHYVRTGVAFDTLRRAANIQPTENANRRRAPSLPAVVGKSFRASL